MNSGKLSLRAALALMLITTLTLPVLSAQDQEDGLVPLVLNLLRDPDKDMRALGLEQIRTQGGTGWLIQADLQLVH